MEKSIEQDLFSCMQETFSLKEVDIREYSPLTLAYIGDSIYDMKCAEGAGVPRALALWGCKNPEEITADYRLSRPIDILDLL